MKNLVLDEELGARLPLGEGVAQCCLNPTEPKLYLATSSCDVLCMSLDTLKVEWRQPISAVSGGPDSAVTGFCFSLELESICISLSTGELLLLNVETQQMEEVGAVEGGIMALKWSPDGEVFAAVSGAGNILLMDQDWEMLAEVHMADPPPDCQDPEGWFRDVQLSWRGDGKFFATSHKVIKDGTPQRVMHVWDRTAACQLHATCEDAQGLLPVLAWQPNGRHLYTVHQPPLSTQQPSHGARPGAASRRAPGRASQAQPAQPSDAAAQQQQQQGVLPPPPHVLLYERNGLGHGGFPLRARGRVVGLEWSSDSELLAVLQEVGQQGAGSHQHAQQHSHPHSAQQQQQHAEGQQAWQLQVWHRSNWHWYLKFERRYSSSTAQQHLGSSSTAVGGSPSHTSHAHPLILWDDKLASRLHVVVPGSQAMGCGAWYEQLQVLWDPCVSDRGTAVVVDGRQLLLTPLRHSVVPPPMCAARAVLPSSAGALAISSSAQSEDEVVAAALSDGRLALLRSCEEDLWEETLEEELEARAPCAPDPSGSPTTPPPHTHDAADSALLGRGDAYVGTSTHDALQPQVATVRGWPLHPPPRVRALCWLGGGRLLAVQAAWSPAAASTAASEGGGVGAQGGGGQARQQQQSGQGGAVRAVGESSSGGSGYGGDVLVELQVAWPGDGEGVVTECEGAGDGVGGYSRDQQGGGVGVRVSVAAPPIFTSPGVRVLRVVPHAAGGALVAMATGELRHYLPSTSLSPSPRLVSLGPSASFPTPCPKVIPLPSLPPELALPTASPTLGLSRQGSLFWGNTLVAPEVTSAVTRTGGPGGPALLFCTRRSLMYTVFLAQLGSPGGYTHRELAQAQVGQVAPPAHIEVNEMRAAMHQAMKPNAKTAAARDVVVRAVEQGSHLLTAPKDSVQVIMQMPRGNLEVVAPRMLVLAAIAAALQERDYALAWELATTNRVDLNLIVDWNWPAFLYDLPAFVAAVPTPSDLTDLLFALRPGNICEEGGLYAGIPIKPCASSAQGQHYASAISPTPEDGVSPLAGANGSIQGESSSIHTAQGGLSHEEGQQALREGKVNAVCRAMRAAVQARMRSGAAGEPAVFAQVGPDGVATALPGSTHAASQQLLTVLVTTYSRSDPPQLGHALQAIKDAKEAALAENGPSASGQQGPAENALRAMLLHVDADAAYRAALGLYELPLAFMVITHSQRDPAEYALELQRFAAVSDPHMRRFAIDMHLRRFSLALDHLVAADREAHFEQALALAQQHSLLRQLLALYQADPAKRRIVLRAYGEALETSHKLEDAGVAYTAAGALPEALRAYRSAGQWRQVFVLAVRLGYDATATTRLAAEFADELAANAQHSAAAAVLLNYLGDVDSGVATLTVAREWHEALRTAYASHRHDLVTTVITPAAAEAAAGLLSDAREGRDKVRKYAGRLREVRGKREGMEEALRAAAEGEDGAGPTYEEMADAASETGASVLTGMSMYTDTSHVGGPGGSLVSGSGAASSTRASTLGGRKAQKAANKRANANARKGRVKQGSPEEEASLVDHVFSLAPPQGTLSNAGALAELLVMLEHEEDARTLQAALAEWAAAHQEAIEDIYQHPFPEDKVPHAYRHILELQKRPAKLPHEVAWKWDILRPV